MTQVQPSKAQGIIAKIKALFAEPAAGEQTPADERKQYNTADGVALMIDRLEVGGSVQIADGTPAPAGPHALEDGTAITLDEAGMILAVEVPAADPAPTPEAQFAAMQAMEAKFATGTPEERIANIETMCKAMMRYNFGWKIEEAQRAAIETAAIEALKKIDSPAVAQMSAKLAAAEKKIETAQAKHSQIMEQVLAFMEEVANAPAADPITPPAGKSAEPTNKKEKAANILALGKANADAKA